MGRGEHRRPDETRTWRRHPRTAQGGPRRRVLQLVETELHVAVALRHHVLRDRDGRDLRSALRYRAVRGHLPLFAAAMRRAPPERPDFAQAPARGPPALRADGGTEMGHRDGECTICGGPYYDSYSVVKGSYTFVPTDIFIPGCPVRPEALIDGFLKLSAKIKAERGGWVRTKKGRLVSARTQP